MPIIRIPKLTGGLNELANAENTPDDVLQASSNYEILGDGKLTKRNDSTEYGTHVSGDALNAVIADIFAVHARQISDPLYPIRKLEDMTGDFIILVFGQDAVGLVIYAMYENDENTWGYRKIEIKGVKFNQLSYLEFTISNDRIIITDTYEAAENPPFFVLIDPDGELVSGTFGVPPPVFLANMEDLDYYPTNDFEEVESNRRLGDCGLIQFVYTVETEQGEESNPSPVCESRNMQFFKKDTTDFNNERWVKRVRIFNLSIPIVSGYLKNRLKYFNVYYRIVPYSGGDSVTPFSFSQRYEIIDKENVGGETANNFTMLIELDLAAIVSYEKDIAPVAQHSAESSGIIALGNVKEKLNIALEFDHYCPIKINHLGSKNYVDAIVSFRLNDYVSAEDGIEELDWTVLAQFVTGHISQNIRIFDDDLVTPLMVGYLPVERFGHSVSVWVKIPLLVAGQTKTIYLAWSDTSNTPIFGDLVERFGQVTKNYDNIRHGRWFRIDNGYSGSAGGWWRLDQQGNPIVPPVTQAELDEYAANGNGFFRAERVLSIDAEVCMAADIKIADNEALNTADVNRNGEFIHADIAWIDERIAKTFNYGVPVGKNRCIQLKSGNAGKNSVEFPLTFTRLPDQVSFWGRVKYESADLWTNNVPLAIAGFRRASPKYGLSLDIYFHPDLGKSVWALIMEGSAIYFDLDHLPSHPHQDGAAVGDYFVCLSINKGVAVSLFIADFIRNEFHIIENLWTDFIGDNEPPIEENWDDIEDFSLGYTENASWNWSLNNAKYDQWQVVKNKYLSATDENDIRAVKNLADFMPPVEVAIGVERIETTD